MNIYYEKFFLIILCCILLSCNKEDIYHTDEVNKIPLLKSINNFEFNKNGYPYIHKDGKPDGVREFYYNHKGNLDSIYKNEIILESFEEWIKYD